MALSNELLSQFAKIIKAEDKKVTKETTVYGTISVRSDRTYVKIDGSDLLTPVSTTSDAENGERVTILLKNHTATVTGNISSPAVRSATVVGVEEDIKNLQTDKVSAKEIEGLYANIDFSNISYATMQKFYADSGLISDVVVNNGTITGRLVGVTIVGDLIEAGTLVADKLVIKGQNGLYYKLNTDGVKTEAEQTNYNSLNGQILAAKSITASKINVSDLVAFGATIGGFHISNTTLYSGSKSSVGNTTRGVFLGNDGQTALGDATNYIKYYKDSDGTYKLAIAANDITFGVNKVSVESAIDSINARATVMQDSIADSAKTATDYLNLSSSGLVVGQNPSSPTAGNTLIGADGVTIRKGTTTLAAFKAGTRTASGISAAALTSTDSTDSESDGVTTVSGTITNGGSRSNVYITTNGNPVYFPKGLETDKVLINNDSGIISNANIVLNGSLVDKSGEGILTPLNSYGNMVIGYGRYQDGGATHVYGTRVKAKTKSGFSASVNGSAAIETNNSSGNATFGWHLYSASSGATTIYGNTIGITSRGNITLDPNGATIRINGNIDPITANTYFIGTVARPIRDIYLSGTNNGRWTGCWVSDGSAGTFMVGTNSTGIPVFGNTSSCTNIIGRSTTTSSTGYSFKITCGDNSALTANDNDARLLLYGGTDSTSRYLGSMAVYKRTYSSAANMHVTDAGMMGRSTSSSRRYKKDIVNLPFEMVKNLYNLPVRQFKYTSDYISEDDERYELDIPGFIAEEVAEYLPIACDHIRDENGDRIPEMWNSQIIIPVLLKLIQDLNKRVIELERVEM